MRRGILEPIVDYCVLAGRGAAFALAIMNAAAKRMLSTYNASSDSGLDDWGFLEMDGWYYKLFGAEFGPITFEELVEIAKSQTICADDEIRFGEEGNWRRAGSMGQLMAHLPYQAQAATKPVSTTASPGDSYNHESTESPSNQTWSDDSDFETSAEVEPPKVEDRWWCNILGNEVGPMTFEELGDMAKNHTMSRDDQVRFGESGHWRRAGSIGPLMAHFPFQAAERVITTGQRRTGDEIPVMDVEAQSAPVAPVAPAPKPRVVKQPAPAMVPPAAAAPAAPSPSTTEDRWWCLINDKEYGPVDLAKIKEWAASGRLHAYDYLRMGLGEYVQASEIHGLFPKRPDPTTRSRTSAEMQTRSFEPSAAPKRATDSAMSALSDTAPAMMHAEERESPASAPVTSSSASMATMRSSAAMSTMNSSASMSTMNNSGGFGGGSSGAARAPVAFRRPVPSKSSSGGGIGALLLGPVGMGVGGVVVLGALIYFALPFITGGSSAADIKRVETMEKGWNTLIALRSDGGKPEEIKKEAGKLNKLATAFAAELKGAKGASLKVLSAANKIKDVTKKDLSKEDPAEKEVTSKIKSAKTALKMK